MSTEGGGKVKVADKRGVAGHIDVAETLRDRALLLIGCTGFVGKVALSMLLDRYPDVGRIFILVRPGMGNSAQERFFSKVATSPVFDPLRKRHGERYLDFLAEKVAPIPGDIGRPMCNFGDAEFAAFESAGGLDCIVNSAGLVSFTPSLESAIRINTQGALNVLELARKTEAALLHVSTCYVAGRRDGDVWESEPVVGYFPRNEELADNDFDALAELEDCKRLMEQVRARANDRARVSEFREAAIKQLEKERRDPDDPQNIKLAVARQRKMWMHKRLMALGVERAEHWGWTNTYTYTKSLGEQIILQNQSVRSAIVRPAIVESSLSYPFPGWNEGFNTTAPLIYMLLKGHRNILVGERTPLDVVPVDLVCSGMLAVTAALIAEENEDVYQLGTSHENPVTSRRLAELSALAVRKHLRSKAKAGEKPLLNRLRARLEGVAVQPAVFDRWSAPQIKRAADGTSAAIDKYLPRWGAPRLTALAERAQEELEKASKFAQRATDVMDLFKPFTHDCHIVFRTDNIKALHSRLAPADQERLPWNPHEIAWRDYWFDSHFPGLQKWVFPVLDDEFSAKPKSVYTYKDLIELFDATTKLNKHRVALRYLRTRKSDADPDVYTYERMQELCARVASTLYMSGVRSDDRVMLMSEGRPEWAIAYFGIMKANGVAVPVDAQLSPAEVANLLRASEAKGLVLSWRIAGVSLWTWA